MGKDLTDRQRAILNFIAKFRAERSYPPTMREIGKRFGIASSSVHQHVEALSRKGVLRRTPGRSRSMEVVSGEPSRVPILGRVAAGLPLLAAENLEGHLAMPQSGGGGDSLYALRVIGESMIGAGILPGDFVIARHQDSAENGDIVVARLENDATVKRLKRRGREWVLQPENEAYKPIPVSGEVQIQGKVIAVHRVVAGAR